MASIRVRLGVLGVLLAAGCLGLAPGEEQQPGPEQDLDDEAVVPEEVAYWGCREQVGVFTLPSEAYQDRLPEGFEPRGPEGDEATALVSLYTWACEETEVDGVASGPVVEMVGMVSVDPPDEYEDEEASAYAVIIHGVSNRSDLVEVYEAWGLNMEQGHVEMDTDEVAGAARAGEAVSEASFRTELDTSVAGPVEERAGGEARFFGVVDAELTAILDGWWVDVPAMQEGEATLVESNLGSVPPDAFPLEGVGIHYFGEGFGFGYERVPIE